MRDDPDAGDNPLILRDSGVIFDLTSEDEALASYRQVVFMICYVSHIQLSYQLATTGYNRHLILLSAQPLPVGQACGPEPAGQDSARRI